MLRQNVYAQTNLVGHYQAYYGYSLAINEDSTFEYEWHFDLLSSWVRGKWRMNKDTINLIIIPVYDTLVYKNDSNLVIRDLQLSDDELPDLFYDHVTLNTVSLYDSSGIRFGAFVKQHIAPFTSHRQDIEQFPTKLVNKRGKLFSIIQGKVNRKKVRGIWLSKKRPPYFFKINFEAE